MFHLGTDRIYLQNNTARRNLTKLQTLGSEYTFPKVFGALNPNPISELLHHLRLLRNPNLKMQKTLFFAIFGVKLHRELNFFLKNRYGIWITLQNPFWNFQISFFFLEIHSEKRFNWIKENDLFERLFFI